MHLHRAITLLPYLGSQVAPPPAQDLALSPVTPAGTWHPVPAHPSVQFPRYSSEHIEAAEAAMNVLGDDSDTDGTKEHDEVQQDKDQETEEEVFTYHQLDRPLTRHLLQDSAAQVCKAFASGLKSVAKICDVSIRYPTGASVRKCTKRVELPDDCARKQSYSYPCLRGMCDGWTCIPGTSMQTVSVPCGIDVDYKNVRACSSNRMRDLAERGQSVCSCSSKIMEFLSSAEGKLARSGALTRAASRAISAHSDYVACLAESGFRIQSNEESARENLRSTPDLIYVVLPKIRLGTYIDLVHRLGLCAATGECETVISLFTDYLADAGKDLSTGVERVLTEWLPDVQQMIGLLSYAREKLESISSSDLDTLASCVYDKAGSSASRSLRPTLNALKDVFQTSSDVAEMKQALESASDAVKSMTDTIDALSSGVSVTTAERVMSMARNGGSLPNVLKSLFSLSELEKMPSRLQRLSNLAPSLRSALSDSISRILQMEESGASSCFSDGPIAEAIMAVKITYETTQNFHFRSMQMHAGIQTYHRWTDISMDLPCSRSGRKCFNLAGQSTCVNYPELYACHYEQQIPFPNEHIPFVSFTFQ